MLTYYKNLNWLKITIQNRFTEIYDKISSIITPFCEKLDFIFEGIDFSPAQYPTEDKSIGTAIEAFEMGDFGELGTVFGIMILNSDITDEGLEHIIWEGTRYETNQTIQTTARFILNKRHREKSKKRFG